jgi:hypothetical protein
MRERRDIRRRRVERNMRSPIDREPQRTDLGVHRIACSCNSRLQWRSNLTGRSLFAPRGLAQSLKIRTDQRVMMPIKSPCEESAARAAPGALQPCKGPWVLIATILASSMAFIDGTVVNVALPALQTALRAAVTDIQWVVESYALLLASLLLLGGSLGDVYGRRRVFLFGVLLFAIGSSWCGLASSITSLIVARGLQGIGAAFLIPAGRRARDF